MIRRTITLGLCIGSFWLGASIERQRLVQACRAEGVAAADFAPCVRVLE